MNARDASRRHPAAVVAGLGLGQVVAFACSFYLMGVLGDAVARALSVGTAFVFATVSLSLAVPALVAARARAASTRAAASRCCWPRTWCSPPGWS